MQPTVLPGEVYRIGRSPDAWLWPDWAYAQLDGSFGSPWDDPFAVYRVLLLSTSRLDVFIEALAVFVPDRQVLDALDPKLPAPAAGIVPDRWIQTRVVGSGITRGRYANLLDPAVLDVLSVGVPRTMERLGVTDISVDDLLKLPMEMTRHLGRHVYSATDPHGSNTYDGVVYPSMFRPGVTCVATFETGSTVATVTHPITRRTNEPITRDDPDLHAAMRFHGLRFQDGTAPRGED